MDLNNSGLDKILKIFTISVMGGVLNAVWQISKGQPPQHALASVVLAVLTGVLTGFILDEISGIPNLIIFTLVSIASVFSARYLTLMEYLVTRVDKRVRRVADDYIEKNIKENEDDK